MRQKSKNVNQLSQLDLPFGSIKNSCPNEPSINNVVLISERIHDSKLKKACNTRRESIKRLVNQANKFNW